MLTFGTVGYYITPFQLLKRSWCERRFNLPCHSQAVNPLAVSLVYPVCATIVQGEFERARAAVESLPAFPVEAFFRAAPQISDTLRTTLASTTGVLTAGFDCEQIWEQLRMQVRVDRAVVCSRRRVAGLMAHGHFVLRARHLALCSGAAHRRWPPCMSSYCFQSRECVWGARC